jgi:formate-dependent nitrite reductase membrane component NrfD/ferredoxin
MYRREDGIVDFDKSICIGCKACIAACPYDAIFINPEDHSAEKCNFCAHRLDVGLEPACAVVCPTEAILVGDLNDPSSKVASMVHRDAVAVRRPEKETRPKLFYRGAHQATLDPLAAQRPAGNLFMWSEQLTGGAAVVSGHPDLGTSSAAALLSYDIPHYAPWDWRVSLYTLTKGIAAGSYAVPGALLLAGILSPESPLWTWAAPLLASIFLALTFVLLISDLKHPLRFYMIFTRPQWKSWLVRGAFILAGFSALLALHLWKSLAHVQAFSRALAWTGVPVAVAVAIYTAYLFAQAKARDLWQNPLLPPHLMIQAIVGGSAVLLPIAARFEPAVLKYLVWTLAASSIVNLGMIAGEVTLTHGTAHARLATQELVRGRFRAYFWTGIVLTAVATATPWLSAWLASSAALLGLLAYEHAYVQSGQAVPLA